MSPHSTDVSLSDADEQLMDQPERDDEVDGTGSHVNQSNSSKPGLRTTKGKQHKSSHNLPEEKKSKNSKATDVYVEPATRPFSIQLEKLNLAGLEEKHKNLTMLVNTEESRVIMGKLDGIKEELVDVRKVLNQMQEQQNKIFELLERGERPRRASSTKENNETAEIKILVFPGKARNYEELAKTEEKLSEKLFASFMQKELATHCSGETVKKLLLSIWKKLTHPNFEDRFVYVGNNQTASDRIKFKHTLPNLDGVIKKVVQHHFRGSKFSEIEDALGKILSSKGCYGKKNKEKFQDTLKAERNEKRKGAEDDRLCDGSKPKKGSSANKESSNQPTEEPQPNTKNLSAAEKSMPTEETDANDQSSSNRSQPNEINGEQKKNFSDESHTNEESATEQESQHESQAKEETLAKKGSSNPESQEFQEKENATKSSTVCSEAKNAQNAEGTITSFTKPKKNVPNIELADDSSQQLLQNSTDEEDLDATSSDSHAPDSPATLYNTAGSTVAIPGTP